MVEGIQENGSEDADKVARSVLAERHAREVNDLEQRFAAEKKIMVDDAVTRVNEKYEKRRVDVLKRHEDELTALQVNIELFLLVFSENLWGFILWTLAKELARLNSQLYNSDHKPNHNPSHMTPSTNSKFHVISFCSH